MYNIAHAQNGQKCAYTFYKIDQNLTCRKYVRTVRMLLTVHTHNFSMCNEVNNDFKLFSFRYTHLH